VKNGDLSGLERFEGPDPAEYCPRGFAVVNVDSRGAGDSEGSIVIMGSQEGEDGHDVIEALAKMPWYVSEAFGKSYTDNVQVYRLYRTSRKLTSR